MYKRQAPLDAATATNPRNYKILGPNGQPIAIRSVDYDPASMTVTLHPRQRLNFHLSYRLIVDGSGTNGIRGVDGTRLDGSGASGTNYKTTLTWRNLATPLPARFRHASSHARNVASKTTSHVVAQRVKLPAHTLKVSPAHHAKSHHAK